LESNGGGKLDKGPPNGGAARGHTAEKESPHSPPVREIEVKEKCVGYR